MPSQMARQVKNLPAMQEMQFQSLEKDLRCPGEGNGNPLQYFCLEYSNDRGTWRAIVHEGCKELDTTFMDI